MPTGADATIVATLTLDDLMTKVLKRVQGEIDRTADKTKRATDQMDAGFGKAGRSVGKMFGAFFGATSAVALISRVARSSEELSGITTAMFEGVSQGIDKLLAKIPGLEAANKRLAINKQVDQWNAFLDSVRALNDAFRKQEAIDVFVERVRQASASTGGWIFDLDNLHEAIAKARSQLVLEADQMGMTATASLILQREHGLSAEVANKFAASMIAAGKAMGYVPPAAAKVVDALAPFREAVKSSDAQLRALLTTDLRGFWSEMIAGVDKSSANAAKLSDALKESGVHFTEFTEAFREAQIDARFEAIAAAARKWAVENGESLGLVNAMLEKLKVKMDELKPPTPIKIVVDTEEAKRRLEEVRAFARTVADAIGQAFSTALEGLILDAKSFQEVLRDILRMLARMFFQAAGQALGNAFSGLFGGGGAPGGGAGGVGGGVGMGAAEGGVLPGHFTPIRALAGGIYGRLKSESVAAAKGGILPGHFAPIQAFQGGGITRRPTIGLIGERNRPEAVVPLPDGRSIPVEMRGSEGGTSVTVNFAVQAMDAQSFEAWLAGRGQRAIRSVILDAIGRDPSMRRAIRGAA